MSMNLYTCKNNNSCYGYQKMYDQLVYFKIYEFPASLVLLLFLEPETKKMAVADPLIGMRGPGAPIGDPNVQSRSAAQSPTGLIGLGGICSEDIRVPDKMVGLSKYFFPRRNYHLKYNIYNQRYTFNQGNHIHYCFNL